jgi:hypothetical protein
VSILFGHSGEDRFAYVSLSETAGRVHVAVRLRGPRGLRTMDRRVRCVTVRLAAPLGDRRIRDDTRRGPVRRRAAASPDPFIGIARCPSTRSVRRVDPPQRG